MKTVNTKPMILFVALIAIAMSGCGKKNNDPAPGTPGYPTGGVYPQGNYPGGTGGTLGSACTPISAPIQFSGGIYIDSANIYAGQGATAPTSGYQGGYTQGQQMVMMTRQGSSDGMMTIQANMTGINSANAYGQIQLSQLVIQHIQYQMQMSGVPYGQVPCASIVAINIGHYNTLLYGGTVQIMINGTIPYRLYF